MESMDIDFKPPVDLQLYCCKFYNQDVEVQHTYLLAIPGKNDSLTFRINFDQTAEPNEETLKLWTSQPWYYHSIVDKYHMVNPVDKLPETKRNPFERQWTRWF